MLQDGAAEQRHCPKLQASRHTHAAGARRSQPHTRTVKGVRHVHHQVQRQAVVGAAGHVHHVLRLLRRRGGRPQHSAHRVTGLTWGRAGGCSVRAAAPQGFALQCEWQTPPSFPPSLPPWPTPTMRAYRFSVGCRSAYTGSSSCSTGGGPHEAGRRISIPRTEPNLWALRRAAPPAPPRRPPSFSPSQHLPPGHRTSAVSWPSALVSSSTNLRSARSRSRSSDQCSSVLCSQMVNCGGRAGQAGAQGGLHQQGRKPRGLRESHPLLVTCPAHALLKINKPAPLPPGPTQPPSPGRPTCGQKLVWKSSKSMARSWPSGGR